MRALAEFAPSGARGAAVDQNVRNHLAESIGAIAEALGDLDVNITAALADLAGAVRAHQVSASVMAAYFDAVEALASGEDIRAHAALQLLASPDMQRRVVPTALTLRDADLGPGMAQLFLRHVNDNQTAKAHFQALNELEFAGEGTRLRDSLHLLHYAAPELASEVHALTPQIILVKDVGDGDHEIHGASSFQLWGSILVNAEAHPSRVRLAEVIAHESGHALLHGLTLGTPLVANDPDETYSSPLRVDPRPMEGIAHATYVLARMHYAIAKLLGSGELTSVEQTEAHELLHQCADLYTEGLGTVHEHARFNETGAQIFAGAEVYMRGAASASL